MCLVYKRLSVVCKFKNKRSSHKEFGLFQIFCRVNLVGRRKCVLYKFSGGVLNSNRNFVLRLCLVKLSHKLADS
jgi:hypothetical protein